MSNAPKPLHNLACSNCRVAKTACDGERPCGRCLRLGNEVSCENVPRKKTRITKTKSVTSQPPNTSSAPSSFSHPYPQPAAPSQQSSGTSIFVPELSTYNFPVTGASHEINNNPSTSAHSVTTASAGNQLPTLYLSEHFSSHSPNLNDGASSAGYNATSNSSDDFRFSLATQTTSAREMSLSGYLSPSVLSDGVDFSFVSSTTRPAVCSNGVNCTYDWPDSPVSGVCNSGDIALPIFSRFNFNTYYSGGTQGIQAPAPSSAGQELASNTRVLEQLRTKMAAAVSDQVVASALNVILHSGRYFPCLFSGNGTLGYCCFIPPAMLLSACDDGFARLLGHDSAEVLTNGLVLFKEIISPLFLVLAHDFGQKAKANGIDMVVRPIIFCKKNPLHFIRLLCFVRLSGGVCMEVLEVERDFLSEEDVARMIFPAPPVISVSK